MSSAFLTVTQAVQALLAQAPAVAADIERSRDKRVAPETAAALRIYPVNADGQAAAVRGGFHRWTFDVTVDCYARAALSGALAGDAEAAADALLQAVWQRLAAGPAPAGVSSLVKQPRIAWEFIEADTGLACARLTFAVDLSTNNQTLALWS